MVIAGNKGAAMINVWSAILLPLRERSKKAEIRIWCEQRTELTYEYYQLFLKCLVGAVHWNMCNPGRHTELGKPRITTQL